MIAVFLQARMDSSRLPGKALLPLQGKPIVQVIMQRLKHIEADLHLLVTDREGKQCFSAVAKEAGFLVFEGPKFDVLERFCQAIRAYQPGTVIRATGDNPLVSWELANQILKEHLSLQADYSALQGMPIGLGVEVIRAQSLLEAAQETEDPYDREHVTPFLYKNPQRYYLHRPLVELAYRGRYRVTVDTEEDYQKIRSLYSRFQDPEPSLATLMSFLQKEA
ncbi:MAG: NTP transferase domain-containing protein [Spirochaetales bacterium]